MDQENRGYVRGKEFNELRTKFENLRHSIRQEAQNRTPSPQQVDRERNPIPMYSGDRWDLPTFINLFSWTVTHQVEEALTYEIPVMMTTTKSRAELNRENGQMIVSNHCVYGVPSTRQ